MRKLRLQRSHDLLWCPQLGLNAGVVGPGGERTWPLTAEHSNWGVWDLGQPTSAHSAELPVTDLPETYGVFQAPGFYFCAPEVSPALFSSPLVTPSS